MENKYLYSMKLYITRYCPLDCNYCYVSNKDNKKLIMDFLVAKKSINLFLQLRGKIKNIYLMGGEPLSEEKLLVQILEYIVNYSTSKKINIIIVTSGIYKISKKIKLYINKYSNIKISFSIDGLKKIHNNNRYLKNGDYTWDIIVSNIEILNKSYKYCCTITIIENQGIIGNLFKSFVYMNKILGFNYIHIGEVDGNKWSRDNIILYIKEIKKILEYVYIESKKNNFIYLAGFNRYLMKYNIYLKEKMNYFFDNNLKMFDIDYDGNVGSVFYSVKYNKNGYFNIIDKDIDFNEILNEKGSGMKVLDKGSGIDLNLYLYKIYSENLNRFGNDYFNFILKNNLYI